MTGDLENAVKVFKSGEYTCVLRKGDEEYRSCDRGVKPLLDFTESGNSFVGFSAADKTVGAAAAYLYVLLGVKHVWAEVLSFNGKKILEENGISVSYKELTAEILNSKKDGLCPIEKSVKNVTSPKEALFTIKNTLIELKKKGLSS